MKCHSQSSSPGCFKLGSGRTFKQIILLHVIGQGPDQKIKLVDLNKYSPLKCVFSLARDQTVQTQSSEFQLRLIYSVNLL